MDNFSCTLPIVEGEILNNDFNSSITKVCGKCCPSRFPSLSKSVFSLKLCILVSGISTDLHKTGRFDWCSPRRLFKIPFGSSDFNNTAEWTACKAFNAYIFGRRPSRCVARSRTEDTRATHQLCFSWSMFRFIEIQAIQPHDMAVRRQSRHRLIEWLFAN